MKKEPVNITSESSILPETAKKIKSEINKYKSFDDFLIAKKAIYIKNGNKIVLEFPIDQISDYSKMFVDSFIVGLNDSFIFEKYAKRYNKEDGIKRYTGYFNPFFFWSAVYHGKAQD